MTVLIVGDSFGYGCELEGANEQSGCWPAYDNPRPSDHCFGAQVARMLGQDWENYSIPGGSNDRTFRIIMSKITAKEYDLVIAVWTQPSRMDMTWRGYDMPITYGTTKWYSESFPWFQQLYENHHDPEKEMQMWLGEMISMQDCFKQRKQSYVFTNSTVHYSMLREAPTSMINSLDIDHFPGWPHECLNDWCKGMPRGPEGHFLQEGHDLVAKRIYQHLTR